MMMRRKMILNKDEQTANATLFSLLQFLSI
jgi:hypothetical protein